MVAGVISLGLLLPFIAPPAAAEQSTAPEQQALCTSVQQPKKLYALDYGPWHVAGQEIPRQQLDGDLQAVCRSTQYFRLYQAQSF